MLSAHVSPSATLLGFGAVTPNPKIKDLQTALQTYATQKSYPAANPGVTDGVLGPSTRSAVLAMLPRLPKLPKAVRTALEYAQYVAVLVPALVAEIDKLITSYAGEIASAIRLILVASPPVPTGPGPTAPPQNGTPTPPNQGNTPQPKPPQWYKTGGGMAAIGVGAAALVSGALVLALR